MGNLRKLKCGGENRISAIFKTQWNKIGAKNLPRAPVLPICACMQSLWELENRVFM